VLFNPITSRKGSTSDVFGSLPKVRCAHAGLQEFCRIVVCVVQICIGLPFAVARTKLYFFCVRTHFSLKFLVLVDIAESPMHVVVVSYRVSYDGEFRGGLISHPRGHRVLEFPHGRQVRDPRHILLVAVCVEVPGCVSQQCVMQGGRGLV
jgi:hypothetical protein